MTIYRLSKNWKPQKVTVGVRIIRFCKRASPEIKPSDIPHFVNLFREGLIKEVGPYKEEK